MPIYRAICRHNTLESTVPKIKVALRVDKLKVGDETYTEKTAVNLPEEFRPKKVSTRLTGNTLHFFTSATPLSNHAPTPFSVNGTAYSTMEKYWMCSKAKYFEDEDTYNKLITMDNPVLIKRLAKNIHHMDNHKWRAECEPIILKGLRAKFTQCQRAKESLLATGQLELAECTAHCDHWATGLNINSDNLLQRPWPGANRMGQLLMTVRDDIRHRDESAGIAPPPLDLLRRHPTSAGNEPTVIFASPPQRQLAAGGQPTAGITPPSFDVLRRLTTRAGNEPTLIFASPPQQQLGPGRQPTAVQLTMLNLAYNVFPREEPIVLGNLQNPLLDHSVHENTVMEIETAHQSDPEEGEASD
jgi:hypothetical protein